MSGLQSPAAARHSVSGGVDRRQWNCPQIADLELGALHLGPILLNSTSALGFTIQEN